MVVSITGICYMKIPIFFKPSTQRLMYRKISFFFSVIIFFSKDNLQGHFKVEKSLYSSRVLLPRCTW